MKKMLAVCLIGAMALAFTACGSKEEPQQNAAKENVQVSEEAPEAAQQEENDMADTAYTFKESALGGAFEVDWTLTLKSDGTFTLLEVNPVMGDTTYTGTEYTIEGDTITTGALSGGTPQAGFFNEDLTCEWTIDEGGETITPVNYDPNATVELDGEGPDGAPMDGAPMDGAPMDGAPMDGVPMDGAPQ